MLDCRFRSPLLVLHLKLSRNLPSVHGVVWNKADHLVATLLEVVYHDSNAFAVETLMVTVPHGNVLNVKDHDWLLGFAFYHILKTCEIR